MHPIFTDEELQWIGIARLRGIGVESEWDKQLQEFYFYATFPHFPVRKDKADVWRDVIAYVKGEE